MSFQRGSGILLHITSLPSRFGIGDLGQSAFEFVDFLAEAGQKYWQVLPLGQTGFGNSPYQCFSAFAGNIYLISPEKLAEFGVPASARKEPTKVGTPNKVEYEGAIESKLSMLKGAFENFKQTDDTALIDEFHRFCDANAFWLEDYALFRALRTANDNAAWNEWDESLKLRKPAALDAAKIEQDDEIFAEKFRQFIFFRQWNELKKYANEKGIKIIGDIPIYVAFDSSDVWCNQPRFKLNEDGSPKVIAGVPPDYFSKTGQLWGNPIYDWERMRAEGFGWWVERVRFNLAMFNLVRLDHFIGFTRAWEVPGKDKTAEKGEWASVPGHDLFNTLRYALGDLPLIAEDLGEVTNEVENLRDTFGLPGMRILQFAFGGDAWNIHLPHNHVPNSAVYTGTHDNETLLGWYKTGTKKTKGEHIKHCLKYLKSSGKEINWDMIAAAYGSVARIAIIPMQDILGLDNSARMNVPATADGNWSWRMTKDQIGSKDAERLRELSEFYAR